VRALQSEPRTAIKCRDGDSSQFGLQHQQVVEAHDLAGDLDALADEFQHLLVHGAAIPCRPARVLATAGLVLDPQIGGMPPR
jgi:hypothetical protein